MKKEWKAPEASCLNVKETELRWGGEGVDTATYTVTELEGEVPFDIYGTSTGEQSFKNYVDGTYIKP